MEYLSNLEIMLSILLSSVFFYAASSKVLDVREMQDMLSSIGLPDRQSVRAAATFGPLEVLLASAALATSVWVFLPVLATAALAFAVAGVLGIQSAEPIRCACFSSVSHPLGWRQLLISAVIFGLLASKLLWIEPRSLAVWLLLICACCLLATLMRAVSVRSLASELFYARRALQSRFPA